MLYIVKEGLPNDVNRKIIELRKSEEWKSIKEGDTEAIRRVFDTNFPKNDVKEILLREQHGICAYCMRRICMDSHSRVEHLMPLSKNKDKAIDYMNMLGVCDGGEKAIDNQGRILCCDAHKKQTEIELSPLNKMQMDKIAYDKEGRIFTKPRDEAMERDMNEVLLLNGIQKKDGTVRDTSTELLKGRRDAYDRARRMMETLNKKGKCTSVVIKKLMEKLYDSVEREEYVGVKLYYFRKKYNSLRARGM
ncbi:MAG TPA: TIGR02646 family protein [Lachnospiraceae bacterium]|nr:TIGR02646 family protein [Lachnospiraceae bacterium]